jgi:UV DNA damage endonuclease
VIVIHVGGAAGGMEAAADRFLEGWELLSDAARSRVVIENDDRSFGIASVVALAERCGAPVVWDILHHRCHDPDVIPDREAIAMAFGTWPDGVVPKIHYSSPRLDVGEKERKVGRRVERSPDLPQLRAHADLIDPIAFEYVMRDLGGAGAPDFDVMMEAKAKDLAVLRLREQLASRGLEFDSGRLLVD